MKTLSRSGQEEDDAIATRGGKIIKDGWVDYDGGVVRSEDIQLEQNCPEETIAPIQVCREKITIHERGGTVGTTDYAIQRIPG